jgi:hypothetical protein
MAKPKAPPSAPQQTELELPQPQYGGSYIRQADGSLQLLERTLDTPTAPPGADAAPEEQAP